MKAQALVLSGLVLAAALALALSGRFGGQAQLQETTPVIDPAVLEALEEAPEVDVLISLRGPDVPLAEQTIDFRRQYTAVIQARVLAALTPSDFTVERQFEVASALSGRITKSGVEKLADHPDVVGIALSRGGSVSIHRAH